MLNLDRAANSTTRSKSLNDIQIFDWNEFKYKSLISLSLIIIIMQVDQENNPNEGNEFNELYNADRLNQPLKDIQVCGI